MKLFLASIFSNSAPTEVVPGVRYNIPLGGARIRLDFEGRIPISLRINEIDVEFPEDARDVVVPCIPDRTGTLLIRCGLRDGTRLRYELYQEPTFVPEHEFLRSCVDFRRRLLELSDGGGITTDHILRAVESGELRLLALEKTLTAMDKDWRIDDIRRSLGHLLAVCRKPRQHLRVDEAVRPVAVVKRTGPAALKHLASHGEHWGTRTVGGLKPARLLAHVVEDDLELYENKFVKSLIDRLVLHVGKARQEIDNAFAQTSNALRWDELANEFRDHRRQVMLHLLTRLSSFDHVREGQSKFEVLRAHLDEIHGALSACVSSYFYQSLRHCEDVTSPLRMTNILKMDPHYKPLVDLWMLLDQQSESLEDAVDGRLPTDVAAAYGTYCFVLLLVALHSAGFEAPIDNTLSTGLFGAKGQLQGKGKLRRGDWVVSLLMNVDVYGYQSIHLKFAREFGSQKIMTVIPHSLHQPQSVPDSLRPLFELIDNQLIIKAQPTQTDRRVLGQLLRPINGDVKHYAKGGKKEREADAQAWERFIGDVFRAIDETEEFEVRLIPVLYSTGQDAPDITNQTESLLNQARLHAEHDHVRSAFIISPSTIPRQKNAALPSVLRRLLNFGDTYIETDAKRWGDRRSGMLLISPWQINSLLRLVRLVNTYTIGEDIRVGRYLDRCPICTATTIRKTKDNLHECLSCGARWGQTQCSNTDCQHKFGWLRPKLKATQQAPLGIDSYGAWMEQLENIGGGIAIVGFCESLSETPGARPICPRCGNCPRAQDKARNCPRCDINR